MTSGQGRIWMAKRRRRANIARGTTLPRACKSHALPLSQTALARDRLRSISRGCLCGHLSPIHFQTARLRLSNKRVEKQQQKWECVDNRQHQHTVRVRSRSEAVDAVRGSDSAPQKVSLIYTTEPDKRRIAARIEHATGPNPGWDK